MNSLQVSHPHDETFNIDFNERINSLHISLMNQLELLPNKNLSFEQIFHLIPIIFRFLHKNLQSQKNFSNEYNHLSNTIQKMFSIFTQYIHDRHNHENEIFFFKDKISQLIGQIGYTQYCLEQYWIIIYSLEHEIERLQILLNNPQILQINLQKFQTFQENQKIQLDRFIKDNEKLKILINKQKDSIQTVQTQIEIDLKELQTIKSILDKIKLKQNDIQNHSLQIEKQNSYLQNIFETTQTMEHEYNDRIKTTQIQYELVQKQFHDLKNTFNQTNQNLLSIQTNETNIKQEIETIKNDITTEQTRSMACHDQIKNLRHHIHELELIKRYTHHILKSEEHMNYTLERKRLMFKHNRLKLDNRIHNLTKQLIDIIKQNKKNEYIITINNNHLKDQQDKITIMKISLKKMIHLNNNLEKILQENQFIRINEQEKLHSIKQISFQKRKQLITYTKRLHLLSINEHHLINKTIRNSFEIIRLNNIFHNFNNTEKYFQSILRKKKTEIMKREKHRTSLSRSLRENNDKIQFLNKKNQLIENELESKIDHFHLLYNKLLTQKHDQILLSNRKQYSIYLYQQKLQILDNINKKYDQFELLSNYEINHIINKYHENQQFKLNIHKLKQQIMNMMGKNKRHLDEYLLLNEKIRLYTQLNNIYNQQQQQYSFHIHNFSRRILNLQQENNQLLINLENLQKKTMMTTLYQHNKVLKQENLYQINQILSHRPLIIRDSPIRIHIHKALEDYLTFVKRYMKIIHQCVQWREKLSWINQLYFKKIEQIHQQSISLSTKNEMILRYQIDSKIKQCKAMKAEFRLQTF